MDSETAADDDARGDGPASSSGPTPGGSTDGGVDGDDAFSSTSVGDDSTTAGVVPGCGDGTVGPGEFCFVPGRTLLAGSVRDLAAGDFDGDAALDVVVAQGGSVTLLLGAGDGVFPKSSTLGRGEGQYLGVAVVDLDGDADDDVVAAQAADDDDDDDDTILRTYVNDGTGTYWKSSSALVSGAPGAIGVAELGGDGTPDVVTSQGASSGTFAYFASLGDGSLAAGLYGAAGEQPVSIAAAPLDAGATVDLALALRAGDAVSVVMNDGVGGFAHPIEYPLGFPCLAVVAADFDEQDGVDLAVALAEDGDSIAVLLNDADGSFGTEVRSVGVGDEPSDLAAADMNADGDVDLVVVTAADDGLWFIEGGGDGSFAKAVPITDVAEIDAPRVLLAADFNGDGVPDLAIGGTHGVAFVLSDP